MKQRKQYAALILLFLLSSCAPPPAETPSPTPNPYSNDFAQVDVSRLSDGVVEVRYTGEADVRIKAQITKAEGEDYNYDLPNDGTWAVFSLTEGNGDYTLRVLENQRENRYKPVFDCPLTLSLSDPAAPFRQSNQYVSFTPDSQAAVLAGELTGNLETEREKITAVFDYVTDHLAYDQEKAATVTTGYLPDVDKVLADGKGICFDYAALMSAMLRSQGIPCKLAVGWAGKQYHAWVEVPGEAGEWELMDPTFVSSGGNDQAILDFVDQAENYAPQFFY